MESIRINGKDFVPYITNEKILAAVDKVAAELNNDFFGSGVTPLMLCVLNGSIIFCGHLLPRLKFSCELASIRLKSYEGTKSTGDIKEVIGRGHHRVAGRATYRKRCGRRARVHLLAQERRL
mgnify:CR=1 FL=1